MAIGALRLCHVALICSDLKASEDFYCQVLGLKVVWRPDPDNVYLSNGQDNLALHRGTVAEGGPLDHVGFAVDCADEVDGWYRRLTDAHVVVTTPPRSHRDGSRSLYCRDPSGVLVQIIYLPPT